MTLDRKVTLYQPTISVNNSGQYKRSYASEGNFYAQEIIPDTGNVGTEVLVNDQIQSSIIVTWRMRYQTAIKESWKIGYDSKYYDIVSIAPEGRLRFILVKAKLRDNATL